jgi:hypothetical protein
MTTMTESKDSIKPGERRELKALVKMKIKLLRAEVEDKHAAQMADIEGRVAAKFRDDDARVAKLKRHLNEIVCEANQRAADLFAAYGDLVEPRSLPLGSISVRTAKTSCGGLS